MGPVILIPREMVEAVSELRFPPQADAHLRRLMDLNNNGLLSAAQRNGLEGLVEMSQSLSLLRAAALKLLAENEV